MSDADSYKPRLDEYLRAKGIDTSGKNIRCIDPAHPDHNPSASITEAHRVKCYSCGFNEDIFGCAGALIGIPGKENFKAQLEEVEKVLVGESPKAATAKKERVRSVAASVVPLPRKKALEIYNPDDVLKLAEFTTKKKLSIPECAWFPYYNEREMIDIMVVRFEHDAGKDILTFYYDGKSIKMRGYPVLLYNRHHLSKRPNDPVIIHEGEKCANAGTASLPEFVHTTWNGGGKKFKLIQGMEILRGREIYLWPDDDQKVDKRTGELMLDHEQPGQKTMIELKKILEKL